MNSDNIRGELLALSDEEVFELSKAYEAINDYNLVKEIQAIEDFDLAITIETIADLCAQALDNNASMLRLALHAEMLKKADIDIEKRIKDSFKEIETITSLALFDRLEALSRLGFLRQVKNGKYAPDVSKIVFEIREVLIDYTLKDGAHCLRLRKFG